MITPRCCFSTESAAETGGGHAHRHDAANTVIDVHHHIMPPARLAAMGAGAASEGPTVSWTLDQTFQMMEVGNVSTVIFSTPNNPGSGEQLRHVVREVNEFSTRLGIDHSGKFGLFASLPMPDLDASLRELEYAFGSLKADGVVLQTSYRNKWLGEPFYVPLMEELNRRKAVAFIHPTSPDCCKGIQKMFRGPTIEYGTDTTRAIASLIFGGFATRYPNIKFIFSHGGGSLTSLVARFPEIIRHIHEQPQLKLDPAFIANVGTEGPLGLLKRFHYDIAQVTHPVPLEAIIKLASVSQILFGTDFPWRSATEHSEVLAALSLSRADLRAINRENALKLLPRFET